MPNRKVYFGTQEYMAWVPAPTINLPRGLVGWNSVTQAIDGSVSVRNSDGVHREYQFQWAVKPGDEIDPVIAALQGDWGTDGLYFLDPFAVGSNVLPDCWASPWKACTNGVNLAGSGAAAPTKIATSGLASHPRYSARYDLTGDETPRVLWIPLPFGYTFWFAAWGSATGDAEVQYSTDGETWTSVALLSDNPNQRHSMSESLGGDGGIYLRIGGTGNLTLTSAIGQIALSGSEPGEGPWLTGQGSGKLVPVGPVSQTGYSAALDNMTAITANLSEVWD